MAVRDSMSALITQVRLLINDTDSLLFTSQQIQDILDQNAYIASYEPLNTLETIAAGGVLEYKEFQSDHVYFEADTILTDTAYNEISPDTSDFALGYFTFETSQVIPLLVYGWYYDINNAAADLWDMKASKYADQFDFAADGGDFKLSQKVEQAKKQASEFRAKSIKSSGMNIIERTDVIS